MTSLNWLLALALLAIGDVAGAKVFTFQSNKNGAYVRGSLATSGVGQSAFADASEVPDIGDEESKSVFGAEIGSLIAFGQGTLRLGVELLRPKTVEAIGKSGAGVPQYTLTSEIFSYGPTVTLEWVYSSLESVRFFWYVGGAYHFVDMDNNFELTAAGLTTFNPVTSHTEKSSTTAASYFLGAGFETMFADNVTLAGDFGYRYMPVKGFKHKGSGQSLVTTTVAKGDPVVNSDGTDREFNMSGVTASLGFRFYIDL